MKIDILCSDGSPLGVTSKTVWGDDWRLGVGGAELALITMCEEWTKAGHTVTLYNSPKEQGVSIFEQRNVLAFEPTDNRDILINFRSPNIKAAVAKGLKVWWSCDQHTVGSFKDFAAYMDKIVCISEFHANYFESTYGIKNTTVIDLPVRIEDFKDRKIEKIKNRIIFTSVPDRGLHHLLPIWADIKKQVPDASLYITSDYRLWGVPEPRNNQHRAGWIGQEDVMFVGALPREQYINELLKSQLLVYPCEYEELFCISVSEAMIAEAYPITSWTGALSTTNMGLVIDDFPSKNFFENMRYNVVGQLNNPEDLKENQERVKKKALKRFHPDKILEEWNKKVFK